MAGANYMGGRRNTAKARTKDITGRTQKGHFMKQKHQILVRGLRDHCLDDDSGTHSAHPPGSVRDIGFAHARKDLQDGQSGLKTKTSIQPRMPAKSLVQSSSSPGPSRQSRIRRSKMLEDLDINDPSGLKATMRRILRQPDLAGLSRTTIRSLPSKRCANSGLNAESHRKRQKTSEQTSSNSASSFRYDSPTRKRASGLPLMLIKHEIEQPSFINHDQPSPAARTSAHSSPALAHKTSVGDDSFDSPLDMASTTRQLGSSSDYPDSGFSELQFADDLELEDQKQIDLQPDMSRLSGDDIHQNQHYISPSSGSSFSSNDNLVRKFTLKVPQDQLRKSATLSPSRSFEPREPTRSFYPSSLRTFEYQQNPVSHIEHCNPSLALDETSNPRPLSEDTDDRAEPLNDVDCNNRYGVGYIPPDPKVKYKPFVPLATMLPSYSDDDDAEFVENANGPKDAMHEEAMDSDDGHQVHSGQELTRPDTPCSNASNSPASSMPLGPFLRGQVTFKTPPRRFTPPPVYKSHLPSRPRFSLQARNNACSILRPRNIGASGKKDRDSPYSQKSSSSSVWFSSPLASIKSPVSLHSHHSPNCTKMEPFGNVDMPQHHSAASPLNTQYASHPSQQSSIAHTTYDIFNDPPGAYQVTTPISTGVPRDNHLRSCTVEATAPAPKEWKFFDGPDLFGSDEDDD